MSGTDVCDSFSDSLAELALGILTGRQRAATLAHVEACPHCAEELEQLSRVADDVVLMAPEVEPPVGFEVRLFTRMGVTDTPVRRRTVPPRWVLASAAAVVALVVGLTIGLSMGSHPSGYRQALGGHPTAGMPVASANLVENGMAVGRVATYGGAKPWMVMTLADSSARGRVICEVVTDNGVTHRVGAFNAKEGYGAWGSPLHVSPHNVRTALVVSPNGTVIATAPLG
jgi:hypothetical protein